MHLSCISKNTLHYLSAPLAPFIFRQATLCMLDLRRVDSKPVSNIIFALKNDTTGILIIFWRMLPFSLYGIGPVTTRSAFLPAPLPITSRHFLGLAPAIADVRPTCFIQLLQRDYIVYFKRSNGRKSKCSMPHEVSPDIWGTSQNGDLTTKVVKLYESLKTG